MASYVVRLPPALAVRTAFRGQRARSSVNGGVLESRQPTVPRALRVTVVRVVRRLVVPGDPRGRSVTVVPVVRVLRGRPVTVARLPRGRPVTVVTVVRRLVVPGDPRGRSVTVVRLLRGRSVTVVAGVRRLVVPVA